MKITVLANRDIASNFALNLLLKALSKHQVSVFLSSQVGQAKPLPSGLQQLKFAEQQLFNNIISPALTHQQGRRLTFAELNAYTQDPITELNDINSAQGLAIFKATQPDLVLSIRYGVILKPEAIAVPKMGILNLHSGLLPQYQGVMATFWAMLNNETHIGTTLHTIEDAQIDRGSIIATTQLTVDYKQSYLWHVLNLYQDGVQTMLDAVNTLAEGKPLTSTQPTADGHYYSFPTEEELQAFSRRGLALFHGSELIEFFAHYLENE